MQSVWNPATIVGQFFLRCAATPAQPAVHYKVAGSFVPLTWGELERRTYGYMRELARYGVMAGDRVAVVSENRWEWLVADFASQALGAIHVPIHAGMSPQQTAWEIADCRPRIAILSTPDQLAKLSFVEERLPSDTRFISFDACEGRLAGLPVEILSANANASAEAAPAVVTPADVATIIYTSGTTGEPKGVQLTQGNLASNAQGVLDAFGSKRHDHRLNVLPLSHIYARTCDWYVSIVAGTQMAIAESRESVMGDLQLIRPNVINAVPYFYDKLRRVLEEKGAAQQPGALASLLGGGIEMCNSGGAALPDHVFDYYEQQGIKLRQGYGLTETSPVITLSTEETFRRGSAGKVIPGVEVRIADDGEILTRGPHVMAGYYHDPEGTAQALQDGWLHTGDLGRLDNDGFLFITGRKKELIVTAVGKNVAPAIIEGLLSSEPLIAQAMVVGDGRNYLAALIVPNPEALRALIAAHKIAFRTPTEALTHPTILAHYEQRIYAALAGLSSSEQVRRFVLLSRGFLPERGELTSKLSLRRDVIACHFSDEIESLYAEPTAHA
jgi:long-chain acyl-CoA synthetase